MNWQKLTADIAENRFLLAISGGLDSVVLAHLFKEAGVSFSMAHCNFLLRGPESDKDEEFVKGLAQDLNVEFHHKSFETIEYAKKHGTSIQMAARELRYSWFAELREEVDACLVTAHHANDVAETMLFNLAKGTGIAGLHGIQPFDGQTIRPLLWARKEEILDFARTAGIEWREDHSNEDIKYSRNRIRNKVIPELESINPAFIDAASRTSHRLSDAEDIIDHIIQQSNLVREENGRTFINKERLINLPGNSTMLYRLVSGYGFNYDQVDSILKSINTSGAIFSTTSWKLNVDRDELIITASSQEEQNTVLIEKGEKSVNYNSRDILLSVKDVNQFELSADSSIAALDLDLLNFPLKVRKWQEGDKFQPLGMTGKKLISDFLIDEKVPVAFKKDEFVVISGDDIVWLVGRRIDDRYKITGNTKSIFELQVKGN